jgi:methyl-accepting chemotaxis protein
LIHPSADEFVLKKSLENLGKVNAKLSSGSYVNPVQINLPSFKGKGFEAFAKSKGYSSYPGIGWVATVQVPAQDPAITATWYFAIGAIAVIVLSILLGAYIISGLVQQFSQVIRALNEDSSILKSTSSTLNKSSQGLAAGATDQASSLQETASSIEEISSMVTKSAESASKSIKVAETSQQSALRGKKTVEKMIAAIDQIGQRNTSVMEQFEHNNHQLGNIIKVISEIGNKTKVINDIVFQTKLLSFNASVEAARAGEHGKGFAVVAEEVGNLAQMSGNAAKEIGDMLNDSVAKVQAIVDETKGKVDRLIVESKQSVDDGTKVAHECGQVLEEIVQGESEMNMTINEISTAAQEQAIGVSEINKAIAALDKVTHQNSNVAQETASQADELMDRSDRVAGQVQVLQAIVNGGKKVEVKGPAPIPKSASESNDKTEKSKVLPFKKKSPVKAEKSAIGNLKTAVGSQEELPSANDSRFEEI